MADAILARAEDDGEALRFEGRVWSWRQVVSAMARWSACLRALTAGDGPPHVGALLPNVPEFLFLLGGAALSGTVLVAANATRRGEPLARDLRHTDCLAVVTDGELGALLDGLDLGGAPVHRIDPTDPDGVPASAPGAHAGSGPAVPAGEGHGQVVTTAGSWPTAAATVEPEDLLLLLFTSGSTGQPKAVRVTQGRLAAATVGTGIRRDDVLYLAMPLFHGNALFSGVAPAVGAGATMVLRRRFSASAFAGDLAAEGVTFTATVGRALAHVVSVAPSPAEAECRLRWVLAPEASPADVAAFERRFRCPVVTGYGSSENAVVLVPAPGLPPDALGVAPPGLDVAVVDPATGVPCPRARFDPAGRLVNADEAVGEIVGRNAAARFEGYYHDEEAAAARTRGGWYWTGDLGYVDDAGVFYFAGRAGDWLRVDSENVAAAPVERVLCRLPGCTGAVVFGVPDERTADDQLMAVLELADPSSFDPAAFDRFLAEQPDLGTTWAPRYVRVVSALPVGGTNKVDRRSLQAAGWHQGSVWWRPSRRAPLVAMGEADRAALDGALAGRRFSRVPPR